MAMARATRPGLALTRAAALSTVPAAERRMRLGTTPVPGTVRVALRRGDRAAQAERQRSAVLRLDMPAFQVVGSSFFKDLR